MVKIFFKFAGVILMTLGFLGIIFGASAENETPMMKIVFVMGLSTITVVIGYAAWRVSGGPSFFEE